VQGILRAFETPGLRPVWKCKRATRRWLFFNEFSELCFRAVTALLCAKWATLAPRMATIIPPTLTNPEVSEVVRFAPASEATAPIAYPVGAVDYIACRYREPRRRYSKDAVMALTRRETRAPIRPMFPAPADAGSARRLP
jgi:hypothetical protein